MNAGTDMDLSQPHPDFPFWDRAKLYDTVTGMFLDCGGDDEIARVLSQRLGTEVNAWLVRNIRQEAAMAAEAQGDMQVRRRWIYRYMNLTVNNLVKEYIFLTGERDFLKAKRGLASEIVALSKTNDAGRLWIAVNDALGRNNIGMELIRQLVAYDRSARKIEEMIASRYAKQRGIPADAALAEVAAKVRSFHVGKGGRDMARTMRFTTDLLNYEDNAVTAEDVEFLQEHSSFHGAAQAGGSFTQRLMLGADMVAQAASLVERVLKDEGVELDAVEIGKLLKLVKAGPVPDHVKLAALGSYARRHVGHHDVRNQLGGAAAGDSELRTLKALETVANELLDVSLADRFYTPKEIARAERSGVPLAGLQTELDELNRLGTFELAVRQLAAWQKAKRAIPFPNDRYLKKRFEQQMPSI